MGAVALDHIMHQGQIIGPGCALPDGIDVARLVALGKAEVVAEPKPKPRKAKEQA